MALPSAQEGVKSFRVGSLIRKLKPIIIATIDNGQLASNVVTIDEFVTLKNLSPDLNVHVACVFEPLPGTDIYPDRTVEAAFPAAPGTMQLYPVTHYPECERAILRAVFQDPTQTILDNGNHPLPAMLPIGWEGSTSADEIDINVKITTANWAGTNYSGRVVVQASVAYDGAWQDIKAVEYALGQVQLRDGPANPFVIGTGVS